MFFIVLFCLYIFSAVSLSKFLGIRFVNSFSFIGIILAYLSISVVMVWDMFSISSL